MLTQGSRTLLPHDMSMWSQMINEMFRNFAIKAVSKRYNILQIDTLGKTPESILYGVKLEEFPVKYYHTLF